MGSQEQSMLTVAGIGIGVIVLMYFAKMPVKFPFIAMIGILLFLVIGTYFFRKSQSKKTFEIIVDQSGIWIDPELVHGVEIWQEFRQGAYIFVPYANIEDWSFDGDTKDVNFETGMNSTYYALKLFSHPGKVLRLYREWILPVEDSFLSVLRHIFTQNHRATRLTAYPLSPRTLAHKQNKKYVRWICVLIFATVLYLIIKN